MLKLFSFAQTLAADAASALRRREEGQTMAEYGVVLAVITLAVIAAITLLAGNVSNAINSVANILPEREISVGAGGQARIHRCPGSRDANARSSTPKGCAFPTCRTTIAP